MDFTVSQRNFLGKRRIGCTRKNKSIPVFLIVIFALSVISLLFLDISWIKLFSRIPEIGGVFWKLMHFDVSNIDLVTSSLLETLSITVLSTLYSLVLGLIFGVLAAENLFHGRLLSQCIKSFFTFLRAVPTPIWVLLMMVCFGMGPAAGIAGLSIHTTAFFTKSFAQSFESIPAETLESLEATGVGRLGVFSMRCCLLHWDR